MNLPFFTFKVSNRNLNFFGLQIFNCEGSNHYPGHKNSNIYIQLYIVVKKIIMLF